MSLIFRKSSAAQQEKSQVQVSRVSGKDTHTHTHTCDGIEPGAGMVVKGEQRDDWQKMSGTIRQPHTDTQQVDVRAHKERKEVASSESYVILLKSPTD